MNPGRFIRTVANLQPVQIRDRLLRPITPFPAPSDGQRYQLRSRPAACGIRLRSRDAYRENRFTFLNHTLPFAGPERWHPPDASPLWIYNLHYFQYLEQCDAATGFRLITDWIDSNPTSSGPAWQPFPISLRVREWIEWLLAHPDVPEDQQRRILASTVHQVEALDRQLEFHLLANHLLENAVTLCWAGLSFEGPRAEEWARRGRTLLEEQLREQVLPDGLHFERSPMYQGLITEALGRLWEVADSSPHPSGDPLAALLRQTLLRMLRAHRLMSHPDGDIALFNDAAFGIGPTASELESRFGSALGFGDTSVKPGAWCLPDAGYAGTQHGDTKLFFDGGPIGPRYQPGHGHADTLGIELSISGWRVITDTGIFTYDAGPVRSYDRSTAAHSTVEIDERSHAELWAAFRCGRQPVVQSMPVPAKADGRIELGGAYHFGARRERMTHRRTIRADVSSFEVVDHLQFPGRTRAKVRLHLAPGIEVLTSATSATALTLQAGDEPLARIVSPELAWQIGESPYHPEFGTEQERKMLVAQIEFDSVADCRWGVVAGAEQK